MKKALILGTNAGQADIINYLKDNDWVVHSCGNRKEGPGVELADEFHLVNTIDIDAVIRLGRKLRPDIIYSVSSDVNIRTATFASEALDLPVLVNSETIDIFHFKDKLRGFLNKKNISPVGFQKLISAKESEDWDIFPCVVKPADSQGQRGVELIHFKNGLKASIENAIQNSSTRTAILEEYLEGVEMSTNIIVQGGKILVNEFTERLVHGTHYFGLPKGHSIPLRNVSNENKEQAIKMVETLVKELGIKDAVLYIQMIVSEKGPRIVEVAPRLDGCHIWRLLKHARGYDLREFAIDCLLRNKINYTASINKNEQAYTLAFHQLATSTPFNFDRLENFANLVYNEYRYVDNEIIRPINGMLEVVGYYIKKD